MCTHLSMISILEISDEDGLHHGDEYETLCPNLIQ